MLTFITKQQGNSLIELMISMTLGLASIAAMASLVGQGIALNSSLLAKSRLDEEIDGVIAVIRNDLRRAGFYANTHDMVMNPMIASNPFDESLKLAEYSGEQANSCIVFAYDRNKNGVLDTEVSHEQFGFRLRNGAIEIRLDSSQCDQSGWHDLTDPKVIKVESLTFNIEQKTVQKISQARVNINLVAYLKKYPDVYRSINTAVAIENDE